MNKLVQSIKSKPYSKKNEAVLGFSLSTDFLTLQKIHKRLSILIFIIVCLFGPTRAVWAVEAIPVAPNLQSIDLGSSVEIHPDAGDRIIVSTARNNDGIIRRMEVNAKDNENRDWLSFALTNPTNEAIDRLLVVPFYKLAASGLFWPDLDRSRIRSISSSKGFAPARQRSDNGDVFLITLNPGATVTYVAELTTDRVPQIVLWQPDAYKDSQNAYTLYRGIVLGIAGLLAIFLSILFVVKASIMFPTTAALAWAVLMYLCVDFGFWNKAARLDGPTDPIFRAISELLLVGGLVLFLFGYLALNKWHARYSHGALASMLGLVGFIILAIADPMAASAVARLSILGVAILGLGLVTYLALRGFDRAILIIPTWCLLLAWTLGAGLSVAGTLSNEMVQPALNGGLVLILLLMAFTVMQHAFAGGALAQGIISDVERAALAVAGSGDITWDWDLTRGLINLGSEAEEELQLTTAQLSLPVNRWIDFVHPVDQTRFHSTLEAIPLSRRGRISDSFRISSSGSNFRWYQLRARPIVGSDGEVIRCVGTLLDVTERKVTEERLLQNAVLDSLTGLPNKELFLDRLNSARIHATHKGAIAPSLILLDIDRFKHVNDNLGLSVGDSVLLTIARRLARQLKPQDTLARIDGNLYGILLSSENTDKGIKAFADALQRTIKSPIIFQTREIFLNCSIGVVIGKDYAFETNEQMINAEISLYQAKNRGGGTISYFSPEMKLKDVKRSDLEMDLKKAIQSGQLEVQYQPIMRLRDRAVAGFEALVRWNHPKYGMIPPADFIPIAERTRLINDIGKQVLDTATRQVAIWQLSRAPEGEPIFLSVNLSSRQLLRYEIIADVKSALLRSGMLPSTLKLELTESLMLENPEKAIHILERLRDLGVGLSLDDFGTGYSSLSYLQQFRFEMLKIDKSFVSGSDSRGRTLLLHWILSLAQDLDMEVVAEGVESETEALKLTQLGCGFAQGFFFGHPVSAQDASIILQHDGDADH